ncbi:hypothetical protein [Mastigocoleus sp. MO_188.B34]|uniref:hypothetical protein n=1 Tax=Mastigocoleus sp. MO_188.B34 TaxID=3036635 RepID=UPI00261E0BEB|nr:hypothetical protein [Mastigocoleus sp. MO_188.B34]MDJ0695733.1 hypothetical protein [Mastigocoleus sp. MO_188.B34]
MPWFSVRIERSVQTKIFLVLPSIADPEKEIPVEGVENQEFDLLDLRGIAKLDLDEKNQSCVVGLNRAHPVTSQRSGVKGALWVKLALTLALQDEDLLMLVFRY